MSIPDTRIEIDGYTYGFQPATLPDGRLFIPDTWCVEHPPIEQFCLRFPDYWKRDLNLAGYVAPPR